MSPHALTPATSDACSIKAQMRKFAVTENGFLPVDPPLKYLPDSYYAPWERIIHHLPLLLSTGKLHSEVQQLPVLSTDRLRTEPEWRRAYVILSFLLHGYVWGGETPNEVCHVC